jgi:hypothetical protein
MKSFILALALFASTIGIAQITKAETGGREGDTPMGIIGTTIGIIRTTIGIIRNTFGIIRIGVITATDSGITLGILDVPERRTLFLLARLTHRRPTIIRECSTDAPVQLQLKLARDLRRPLALV